MFVFLLCCTLISWDRLPDDILKLPFRADEDEFLDTETVKSRLPEPEVGETEYQEFEFETVQF